MIGNGTDSVSIQDSSGEIEIFSGEKSKYDGPCVCGEFFSHKFSNSRWNELTDGGKYPFHCFECSCGRRWWNYRPSLEIEPVWVIIGDSEAWKLLTKYNGVPMRPIVEHPIIEGFYLLETVRREGLIPIG